MNNVEPNDCLSQQLERNVNMSNFVINEKWCKGCGVCVALCPKKVLELKNNKVSVANEEACIRCRLCEYRCPDFAIFVKEGKA